MRLALRDRDSL
jgi:hypothetical protein